MKQLSVFSLILIDLLAIGVGLNIFALFHIVIHYDSGSAPRVISTLPPTTASTPAPAVSESPAPISTETPKETAEPTPTPIVYEGMFDEKFHDKFTDGEVIATENTYVSRNLNVTYTEVVEDHLIYHVADIYVRDLKYLRTGFGNDKWNGGSENLIDMANRANAVAAISGDHYYARYEGIVIRQGVFYRDTRFEDVCLLLNDGSMVTMYNSELNMDELETMGVYQAWAFGPELLDENGQPKTVFNSNVTVRNPRSAIGCVEPGHYVFVQVDGRIDASWGMTMESLSQLFYDLGCTRAYNLDGGQSSGFVWQGELVSYPYDRPVSDCIYVTDMDVEEGEG